VNLNLTQQNGAGVIFDRRQHHRGPNSTTAHTVRSIITSHFFTFNGKKNYDKKQFKHLKDLADKEHPGLAEASLTSAWKKNDT
jgi:hypothetical protein